MLDTLPGLLLTLIFAPVCAVSVLMILKWMFSNELDVAAGLVAICVILIAMILTIMSKNEIIAGIVLLILVTLMAFLPYAVEQFALAELQGIDIDRLDKAYKQISERPENVGAVFVLAQTVYDMGLPGHAVAIAEKLISQLSKEMDPLKNTSIRDIFRAEEMKAKQWRREIKDDIVFRPVKCEKCGHMNNPGEIVCGGCSAPYLLEIARKIDPRPRIRSRVVIAWAMLAAFFIGAVYFWSITIGIWPWISLALCLSFVAGTLAWLFRKRSLSGR